MSRRKRRFPWGWLVLVLIVLGVGGYFGYQYLQSRNTSGTSTKINTTALVKGSLAATIGASGNVRAGQTSTLTWGAAGRIGTFNIKQGDKVKVGDILAVLDPTSIQSSNLIMAPLDLITAEKNLNDLLTSGVAKAQAQVAVVNAQKAIADAQTSRDLLNYSRGNNGSLDAAYAELYLAQDALTKAQDRFIKVAGLSESDPARASAQTALVAAQQKVDSKQSVVNWYLGAPAAIDFAEADAKLELAKAQLADAQRKFDLVKNGPNPDDVKAAQAKVDIARNALNQMRLVAPFNGTITDVKSTLGDWVTSNTAGLRIDDLSRMLVDVTVSEVDIARVKVSQKVSITFDALSGKTYNGVVESLDDFGSSSSGAVNFTVTIRMTDNDASVKPGLTASVTIILEQADNVLLAPNRGIRTQGTRKYVLILTNGEIQTVNIRAGLSSDSQTQVISETLKEGDLIVTNTLSELQTNTSIRIPGMGALGGLTGGAGAGGGVVIPGGGGEFRPNPGGGGANPPTGGGTAP